MEDVSRETWAWNDGAVRILVTGMSGTGKSTLLGEMAQRGFVTVSTDYDGWTLESGEWDELRMDALLAEHPDVVVDGTVPNQGKFYDRFDHVVLLSAPIDVLIERVTNRTNNPYGRTQAQREEIRHNVLHVEPLIRKGATIELDATLHPAQILDAVLALVQNG